MVLQQGATNLAGFGGADVSLHLVPWEEGRPTPDLPPIIDEPTYRGKIIIQFRVAGKGTHEEWERACLLEKLLDQALDSTDNGWCDWVYRSRGSINVELLVNDVQRAVSTVLETLSKAGLLEGIIVAERIKGGGDRDGYKVWWPEGFTGQFSTP